MPGLVTVALTPCALYGVVAVAVKAGILKIFVIVNGPLLPSERTADAVVRASPALRDDVVEAAEAAPDGTEAGEAVKAVEEDESASRKVNQPFAPKSKSSFVF